MKLVILLGLMAILLSGCSQVSISETPVNTDNQEPGSEEVVIPEPIPESVHEPEPEPILINGKTREERLEIAYAELHKRDSSYQIFNDFPDVEIVFTDDADISFFPQFIRPFNYHYSKEADVTFNICGINRTVFICKGKLDRLLTIEDVNDGTCEITPIYLEDPRLGGSGNLDYDYS